jgi:hypothetical protein
MILVHPYPEEIKQRFPDHEHDIIFIEYRGYRRNPSGM